MSSFVVINKGSLGDLNNDLFRSMYGFTCNEKSLHVWANRTFGVKSDASLTAIAEAIKERGWLVFQLCT